MGHDLPRRPSQQGFHKTFGQGRSIKRDLIQGDSQRPSGDTASNLKRTRNIDRRDERSPVGQRDRLEGSSPTALGANRQRPPDNARPHPSSQSSKSSTSHVSSVPLKPVLDLIAERMTWFRARNEASKSHKRAMANQEQSHYRPSDYASSPELLATQQRQTLEEMRKAEKNLGEFDDRIAAAMQQLLQHMSEAWSKSPDASNASEDREASEAKMNTIQNTIQKEMEESFKKEATESQQLMKDLIGSQMAKLKEALTQENEQKLHSLQKTLAQEAEDRATSLRKTLMQDNEKRVAEMKDSINREHKARIIALENALSEEAKNKARIAALENALSEEVKSKDRIAALERAVYEETKNKDRIAVLEKALFEEARNKDRISALERAMYEETKNKDRIAVLEKAMFEEARNKDRIADLEKALSEEARNKARIAALEKTLSEEASNKARIAALEKALSEEAKNRDRIAALETTLSEEIQNKDRIAELEKILSEEANHKTRAAALEKNLSKESERNAGLGKRVLKLEFRADRAEADQKLLVDSLISKSQLTSLDDKIAMIDAELRMTISDQRILSESWINKAQLAEQLQQLSLSQDKKLGKLEAQVNLLPDHSPRIEELAEQICDHSKLIKDKEQMQDEANLRLDSLESTLTNFLEEGEEIKERVQKLSSTKPVSVSNDQILEVIKPEMAKNTKDTREMIMQIQHKLRPFLEQERHKRETLEEQVGDVARQITEIQKESATTKTDYSGLTEKLDGQTDEVKRLEESTNIRIGLIMDEFRSQMESVYIQVQTLNSWQTNFSTQGLYRDMVNHINRTIPEGPAAVPQIKLLKQQVSGIETRIAAWESTSNKKRKLVSGNARVVNGHQTDM
ncbi:hypothetical protein TrVGV298_008560 [Trichoderma virens]|nr:hypothetical protein TrVGV298_008560 [Trichoderma virens]